MAENTTPAGGNPAKAFDSRSRRILRDDGTPVVPCPSCGGPTYSYSLYVADDDSTSVSRRCPDYTTVHGFKGCGWDSAA